MFLHPAGAVVVQVAVVEVIDVAVVPDAGVPALRREKLAPIPLELHETLQMPIPTAAVAVREAFRVMTAGATLPLADAIRIETEAFLRLAGSPESKEKIAAFFASRKK